MQSQCRSLDSDIADLRASEAPILAALQDAQEKEGKAQRFLDLTAEMSGYGAERKRAEEVRRHCAEDRSVCERRAAAVAKRISELTKSRKQIDTSSFAKQNEIDSLARDLR